MKISECKVGLPITNKKSGVNYEIVYIDTTVNSISIRRIYQDTVLNHFNPKDFEPSNFYSF